MIYNVDNLSLYPKTKTNFTKIILFKLIRNEVEISEILNKFLPDKIINMAAESHVDKSINNPEIFFDSNINGTYHLLNQLLTIGKKIKINLFVFIMYRQMRFSAV